MKNTSDPAGEGRVYASGLSEWVVERVSLPVDTIEAVVQASLEYFDELGMIECSTLEAQRHYCQRGDLDDLSRGLDLDARRLVFDLEQMTGVSALECADVLSEVFRYLDMRTPRARHGLRRASRRRRRTGGR